MKPSARRGKKKRKPSSPSPPQPTAPGLASSAGDSPNPKPDPIAGGEQEDEGSEALALDWLVDAFSGVSLPQISSVLREAGGDPYKAAGILGAQLDDPGERPGVGRSKGREGRKVKRVAAASTGMVSNVIGKGYARPATACGGDGRSSKAGSERMYSYEEAEEFLCSMLGEESELGMGVVRDVLGQCRYDVGKALDLLIDISASFYSKCEASERDNAMKSCMNSSGIYPEKSSNDSPENTISAIQLSDKSLDSISHQSEREHELLQFIGYVRRDYSKVLANSEEQSLPKSGAMNSDLQQKVLESLFNVPDTRREPNSMNWKKVVKQVQSFGQGVEFSFASITEPVLNDGSGNDDYHVCRSAARKHWEAMKSYYHKAVLAYSRGERTHAALLSERGRFHCKLARDADEKASREIFEARNKDIKNIVTIDLHGQHVKPAIGLLKLHLLLFRYTPSIQFLKVITGCGSDGVGKGKLKRSVVNLVEKEGIEWWEENVGTVVLRLDGLKEYSFVECDSEAE